MCVWCVCSVHVCMCVCCVHVCVRVFVVCMCACVCVYACMCVFVVCVCARMRAFSSTTIVRLKMGSMVLNTSTITVACDHTCEMC